MRIRLTGHIDVPPERLGEVTRALEEHIRLTRAEAGCELFDVRPVPGTPGRFTVEEIFRSRADFDAHQARAAASAWGRASAGLARQYRIEEIAP